MTVLRAVARYRRQTGSTYSDRYLEDVLVTHPDVAGMLLELFRTRFGRGRGDPEGAEEVVRRIEKIDAVESLDRDLILRRFLSVIRATLRTNFFQRDSNGDPKPTSRSSSTHGTVLAARAAAGLRDLRLLTSNRGRAPAWRTGGARRSCAGRTGARISAPRCSA